MFQLRRTSISPAIAAAGVASLVVTGCGGGSGLPVDDMTGDEISDSALAALTSATSMRLTITAETPDGEMVLEIAADGDGNCTGSLAMADQGEIAYMQAGNELWVKTDEAFWTNVVGDEIGTLTAELVGGRFLYGTADDELFGTMVECNLDDLMGDIEDEGFGDSEVTKGKVTTLDDVEVIELTMADDEDGEMSLFVEADGDFYPIKLEAPESDEPGEMTFSDFNEPIEIEPPADDDVLDLSELYAELGL